MKILKNIVFTLFFAISIQPFIFSYDLTKCDHFPTFTGIMNPILSGMVLHTYIAQLKKMPYKKTFSTAKNIMKCGAVIGAPAAIYFLITIPFAASLNSNKEELE